MRKFKTILVTGGAGFIGSHVIRQLVHNYPETKIINLDALTYAGNLENLKDIESCQNYSFIHANICDAEAVLSIISEHQPDAIVHLAAESHVDRSILDPMSFVKTNVLGTMNLLQAARSVWKDRQDVLFYHISTDEVFGSLGAEGFFDENTPYDPRSPYSASKAASDHFVRAAWHTYHLPVVISNCPNNYGPYHFPEKLIPLCILNLIEGKPLPVYGKGINVRDWLWVQDHATAIDLILHKAEPGKTYTIGGKNEWRNIDVVLELCKLADELLNRPTGTSEQQITYVKDRAGHDMRYAIDPTLIENELGWKPSIDFATGLRKTFEWYLAHPEWVTNVRSGDYLKYYEIQYSER